MTSDSRSDVRLPPFARFGVVFGWGLRRSLRSKRFVVTALLALLVGFGLGAVAGRERDPVHAVWGLLGEGLLGVAIPLVALALAASGFGEEVQDQTLVFHLVRPVSRRTLFVARFCSGLLPGVVTGAAMLLAAASGTGLPAGALARVAAVAALGVATVGALYYTLASLFRRGLVAGLVYTFLVEGFFQFLPGSIQKLSVMHHVRSVFHRALDPEFARRSARVASSLRTDPTVDPTAMDPTDMVQAAVREPWTTVPTALLLCAVVVALTLGLGARAVARRDFALKD